MICFSWSVNHSCSLFRHTTVLRNAQISQLQLFLLTGARKQLGAQAKLDFGWQPVQSFSHFSPLWRLASPLPSWEPQGTLPGLVASHPNSHTMAHGGLSPLWYAVQLQLWMLQLQYWPLISFTSECYVIGREPGGKRSALVTNAEGGRGVSLPLPPPFFFPCPLGWLEKCDFFSHGTMALEFLSSVVA